MAVATGAFPYLGVWVGSPLRRARTPSQDGHNPGLLTSLLRTDSPGPARLMKVSVVASRDVGTVLGDPANQA